MNKEELNELFFEISDMLSQKDHEGIKEAFNDGFPINYIYYRGGKPTSSLIHHAINGRFALDNLKFLFKEGAVIPDGKGLMPVLESAMVSIQLGRADFDLIEYLFKKGADTTGFLHFLFKYMESSTASIVKKYWELANGVIIDDDIVKSLFAIYDKNYLIHVDVYTAIFEMIPLIIGRLKKLTKKELSELLDKMLGKPNAKSSTGVIEDFIRESIVALIRNGFLKEELGLYLVNLTTLSDSQDTLEFIRRIEETDCKIWELIDSKGWYLIHHYAAHQKELALEYAFEEDVDFSVLTGSGGDIIGIFALGAFVESDEIALRWIKKVLDKYDDIEISDSTVETLSVVGDTADWSEIMKRVMGLL